ncbi:MAG TPA: hypothetical protein VGM88_03880 [Kofleriaceae bacterium]|jgi:hypothetical protein
MRLAALVPLAVAAVLASARPAAAQSPNVAFAGKVMLSDHRFPGSAKSPGAYTAAIRKQSKSQFFEDKESHTWKIYFAGFLTKPLDDVEYVVKLYELQGRTQQLLVSFEQYADQRGEKTILSNMTLDKKQVGVNKQLLITMESKGHILASSYFKILGEGEKFSGKVNFSEEDADGKKKDDDDGN